MQKCTKCLQQKPAKEFYNDPRYNRPRTACKACYRRKSPRRQAIEFDELCKIERRPPPRHTDAPPGSRERIEVYAQRFREGFHLHHPWDEIIEPAFVVDVYLKSFKLTTPKHEIPDED